MPEDNCRRQFNMVYCAEVKKGDSNRYFIYCVDNEGKYFIIYMDSHAFLSGIHITSYDLYCNKNNVFRNSFERFSGDKSFTISYFTSFAPENIFICDGYSIYCEDNLICGGGFRKITVDGEDKVDICRNRFIPADSDLSSIFLPAE